MTKDIKALIAIYTILILVGWNIALNYEIKKEFNEKIEAMETAIYLNEEANIYVEMLESMNSYADELVLEISGIYEDKKLLKDLARHFR